MMFNPTKEELELRKRIEQCEDEEKKKKLKKELFDLEEKMFEKKRNSPFC